MTSWWRKTSRYLSSHSNIFIFTGGLLGGAYLVSQYAISKFQQIQEKLVNDRNAKENLRRRFAQNQEDCTFTVLALLPTLGDQLFAKHDVEHLTDSLRSQAAPPVQPSSVQHSSPSPSLDPQQNGSHPSEAGPQLMPHAQQPKVIGTESAEPSFPVSDQLTNSVDPKHSDTPSPQLNPLARSFVPGTFAATASPQPVTSASSMNSNPLIEQKPDTQAAIPNANTGSETALSSSANSTPTTFAALASKPTEPSQQTEEAPENALAPAQPDQSHLNAQEQRNRILAERQAKLRLWNDLKLTAFTRTITSLYCVVLLTLQTHIQLNLIGRFAYLASVQAQARESGDLVNSPSASNLDLSRGLDHDTERLYLTFSWWFLHRGWDRLSDRVSVAIEKAFAPLSVKAQLSMSDLRALLNDVRYLIEHDASAASNSTEQPTWKRNSFLDVLFPSSIDEEVEVLVGAGALDAHSAQLGLATNDKLRALLDETKDVIESQDFGTILALCIDRVFETFFDSLNPTFGIQRTGKLDSTTQIEPISAIESRFQEITEEMQHGKRVRLASLFPLVSRQSQMAIRGVPNEYIEALADSKELRAFSAVLYVAWSIL
ncbi:related to Peroxisomal assembly protein PEX3 [Melanopsichium pennsylvanicum]|uniref:Related to Peroxisomal assembly protein PEX3 n=2 Tax=Melanopsichium pennsylvanicum TaxID=63383 RepID=A0AAJ5C8F8_9BASI|nr:related to Peroxisomal assembly protein PEX3 [Melanopsichium pennsylvanicum 4]SNX87962.1 related to Peroxisomal assembly protein PEX3 [Melanopsichium pennsylvanicum]